VRLETDTPPTPKRHRRHWHSISLFYSCLSCVYQCML
jgi:hypothetical protein